MDDKTLALLGDRAAQERFTEMREPLSCPVCKGAASIHLENDTKSFYAVCFSCGLRTRRFNTAFEAIEAWNTRAPILTPEQIKRLEDME